MIVKFQGKIWYWRGPAPFYFVTVPEPQRSDLRAIANLATYGWGCIPVIARINRTEWKTSLFPQNGGYIVPIKASVRSAEELDFDDEVEIQLEVRL